ncbi:MAG: hypothetical protein ACJAR1_002733, partial [Rubritalea sp.]
KISGVSRQLHSPLCAFLLPCSSHYFVFLSNHYHASNGISHHKLLPIEAWVGSWT